MHIIVILFKDISLVALIGWIDVTSAPYSIFSRLYIYCLHMSHQLLLLNFDGMIFLQCYFVIHYCIIDTDTWLCISLSLKMMSLFIKLLWWTLTRERFEFPITSSIFDLFKWFVSIMLKCELTAIHHLFLDLNETFLPCFFLDDVITTTIYFYFFKLVLQSNQN